MENQLRGQINELKSMIMSFGERLNDQDQEAKRHFRRLSHLVVGAKTKSGSGESGGGFNGQPHYAPVNSQQDEDVLDDVEDGPFTFSGLNTKSGSIGPRADEIMRLNNTIQMDGGRRVFSYYWIITGITNKMKSWPQRRALRSNSFYIFPSQGGYRMYLKAIPHYTSNTMYLHAGVTKGDYDDFVEWPFTFKMRVQILVQEDENSRLQDLKSRIWDPKELCSGTNWKKPVFGDNPECVGLGFPHEVIRNFIWMDRLVVRLLVYLD